jgi:ferredoxin
MIKLKIDGKEITVEGGTTVLDAARKAGVEIPSLCQYNAIEPPVSCFVCAVRIQGRNSFVPSCVVLAEEGMVVESNTDAVFKTRRQALELLLSHHNGDCEAPCTRICPCSIDIPELVRTVKTGDRSAMIRVIHAAMPFSAVLSYICSAPCEKGCRRKLVDTSVSIRELHRYAALEAINAPEEISPAVQPPTGKKVAIIGAGLAGLSVAYHLSCLGHACIIIEKNSRPAVSTYCTTDYLPVNIIGYEIDQIRKCGVTFQFNTEVTSLPDLRSHFDATVIAGGIQSTQWAQQQGIRCTERGIDVRKGSFATSVEGVFAIGGAIIPGKSSSRTVGQSKSAAQAVHRFLSGMNDIKSAGTGRDLFLPGHTGFDSYMWKLSADDLKLYSVNIPEISTSASAKTDIQATVSTSAERCLQCDCSKKTECDLRRYAGQYGAVQNRYKLDKPLQSERQIFSNGLVFEPGKCILCGRCVGITSTEKVEPGLSFFNRGSDLYVGAPFDEPMDKAMGICMDRCIDACPTGALWKSI